MAKPFDIPGEVPQQSPQGFIMETFEPDFQADTFTHQDMRFGLFSVMYAKVTSFPTKEGLQEILERVLEVEAFIKKAE